MLSPHSTEGIPPQYWCEYPHSTDVIPLHVLMLSPHCTEQPPQYWSYSPKVLKLSPHCTEQPPQYWSYLPTVLNNLHSTEAIPPQYWCYPPMYWTTSNVLNNLQCTEQPPMYWTDVTWGGSFDHPYINVVTFVPRKRQNKPTIFSTDKFFISTVLINANRLLTYAGHSHGWLE